MHALFTLKKVMLKISLNFTVFQLIFFLSGMADMFVSYSTILDFNCELGPQYNVNDMYFFRAILRILLQL